MATTTPDSGDIEEISLDTPTPDDRQQQPANGGRQIAIYFEDADDFKAFDDDLEYA